MLTLSTEVADGASSTKVKVKAQTKVQVSWYSHTYSRILRVPLQLHCSSSAEAAQRPAVSSIPSYLLGSVLCLCLCQIVEGSCLRAWPVPELSSPICAFACACPFTDAPRTCSCLCSCSCSSCDTRLPLVSTAPALCDPCCESLPLPSPPPPPPSPTHRTPRSVHSAAERASGAVRARTHVAQAIL